MHVLFSGLKTMPPPPTYSPDLSPNDFWLYPRMKGGLEGSRFANLEDLEEAVSKLVNTSYKSTLTALKWPMRCKVALKKSGYLVLFVCFGDTAWESFASYHGGQFGMVRC